MDVLTQKIKSMQLLNYRIVLLFFFCFMLKQSLNAQVTTGVQGWLGCEALTANGIANKNDFPEYNGKRYIPSSVSEFRFFVNSWEDLGKVDQECPPNARITLDNSGLGYNYLYFRPEPISFCKDRNLTPGMIFHPGTFGNFNLHLEWEDRYWLPFKCHSRDWATMQNDSYCKLKAPGQFGSGGVSNSTVEYSDNSGIREYTVKATDVLGNINLQFFWEENAGYCNEAFEGGSMTLFWVSKDNQLQNTEYDWRATSRRNGNSFSGFDKIFTGYGRYEFKIKIRDRFNNQYESGLFYVRVVPDCYSDTAPVVQITSNNSNTSLNGTIVQVDGGYSSNGGFRLEKDKVYNLDFGSNITNFCSHYVVVGDDGAIPASNVSSALAGNVNCNFLTDNQLPSSSMELSYTGTGNKFRLRIFESIGSFRVYALKRTDLGTYCQLYNPINIFVGGQNLSAYSNCLIYLPRDLKTIFPDLEPVVSSFGIKYVLTHFNYTVTSSQGICVQATNGSYQDGMLLQDGANLRIATEYVQPDEEKIDNNKNWVQSWGYDEEGRVIAESKTFFDNKGNMLQSQQKNLARKVVLATENIYDKYGRLAATTLPAPVAGRILSQTVLDCGNDIQVGADLFFLYKSNFATVSGEKLSYKNIDNFNSTSKLLTPDPLDYSTPGTLGWYYGKNNTVNASVSSSQKAFIEPNVASTGYPYSRSIFYDDGTNEIKGSTLPGDYHHSGSNHYTSKQIFALTALDHVLLNQYLTVRNTYIFSGLSGNPTSFSKNAYKEVLTDEHQRQTVLYYDGNGKSIVTQNVLTGDLSYTFYDASGRVVCVVTPNGIAQLAGGTAFTSIDKTTYRYNHRGLLVELNETDAGISRYMHSKDGKVRFSENAKQRAAGRFAYILHDVVGRAVEAGEFEPTAGSQITFGSQALTDLLEFGTTNYDLQTGGTKYETVYTVYDLADQQAITDGKISTPEFISGRIAYTYKYEGTERISTWFSYDERGRLTWRVQELPGLTGVKKMEYTYDPKGGVKEVAYQRGNLSEGFYHIYTYDNNAKLQNVYTSRQAPVYNGGSLTSPADQVAKYEYYLHGPLKRTELAESMQGIDYTYTLQGWLKGINHPETGKDPGRDGAGNNSFAKDVFSMQLDYFNGDYSKDGIVNEYTSYNSSDTYPVYFNGVIQHNTWYTLKNSVQTQDSKQGYTYLYNDRYQFDRGDFGYAATRTSPISISNTLYREGEMNYDRNGNILALKRYDQAGSVANNFTYTYPANQNKLTSVSGYADYTYNAIGEVSSVTQAGTTQYNSFNARGLMQTVAKNADYSDPLVKFYYDDSGLRYKKETYSAVNGSLLMTTYYTHDVAGHTIAIYDDNTNGNGIQRKEMYIYGSDRLGGVQFSGTTETYVYELKDHLGSVRAVVSPVRSIPAPLNFSSSFETGDEPLFLTGFIQTIPNASGIASIDEEYPELIWQTKVKPGDILQTASVYARGGGCSFIARLVDGKGAPLYFNITTGALAEWKQNLNGNSPPPQYPLIYNAISNRTIPSVLYNVDGTIANQNDLYLQVMIQAGTATVSASLDNFNVQIDYSSDRILPQATINGTFDYYPWGEEMPAKNFRSSFTYRNLFQGLFAEKDNETGLNAFQLRMYDPIIGRWLGVDSYRQYASVYVGMGNNPVNSTDADGGKDIKLNSTGGANGTGESIIENNNLFHNLIYGTRFFVDGNRVSKSEYFQDSDGDIIVTPKHVAPDISLSGAMSKAYSACSNCGFDNPYSPPRADVFMVQVTLDYGKAHKGMATTFGLAVGPGEIRPFLTESMGLGSGNGTTGALSTSMVWGMYTGEGRPTLDALSGGGMSYDATYGVLKTSYGHSAIADNQGVSETPGFRTIGIGATTPNTGIGVSYGNTWLGRSFRNNW